MSDKTDELANDSQGPGQELAQAIRIADGNHDKGAAALAEALTDQGYEKVTENADGSITYKGERYRKVVTRPVTLKDFKEGEPVEVLNNHYDWVPGVITFVDAAGVHVDSERGPQTIATPARLRKLASNA